MSKCDMCKKEIDYIPVEIYLDGTNDFYQLEVFKTFKDYIKQYGCPLLTEGQLRKFIEDKSKCKNIEILGDIETGQYYANFYEEIYSGIEIDTIENLGTDKFKAYWTLALILAKECVK